MAPPTMCCSVVAPVWQKQHIVSSAIKRGELLVPDHCSVRSQLFLERQPHKQFLKDGAYCHRLTGRRKLKTPSCVSAKLGSVSVVEERDASSVHRGVGTGQETGFGLPEKEKGADWPPPKAVIVGAGPAGALAALVLARQGFEVEVFERRNWEGNSWTQKHVGWNVAVTGRAWRALENVGLVKEVEARGMRITYVTGVTGYGKASILHPRKINFKHFFVPVPELSEVLIRAGMERYPQRIKYHFGMALESADIEKTTASFSRVFRSQDNNSEDSEQRVEVSADLIVGADGLSSAVRTQMLNHATRGSNSTRAAASKIEHDDEYQLPLLEESKNGAANLSTQEVESAAFSVKMECQGTGKAVNIEVPPGMMGPQVEEPINPLLTPTFTIDPKQFTVWARPPRTMGFAPNSENRVGVSVYGIGTEGEDAAGIAAQIKEHFPEISHIFTPDSEACQKLAAQKELRHCTVNMTQFHLNRTVLIGDAAHACYNYAGQGTNLALEDGLILENILVQELDAAKKAPPTGLTPQEVMERAAAVAVDRYTRERKPETDDAAWISKEIPFQDWQEVLAQNDFYTTLAKVIPGLLPWQDVFNGTATPPSQVKKLRAKQIEAYRLYHRSRPYLIALGIIAAIFLTGPPTLGLIRS